jgi:hypothetical protein
MDSEIKQCQNCHKDFTIESEDFAFYAKIKVPAPTFCPECRMKRRMMWRNERTLYKRKCDAPGHNEKIISIYHKDSPVKVYDQKYWLSDQWDPMKYGLDYDFSKSFFEQWRKLFQEIPHQNLMVTNDDGSLYCNWVTNTKNCYLSSRLHYSENCLYSNGAPNTKDSVDVQRVVRSELCYECINCNDCYKLSFSQYCESCVDSMFLYDCRNCQFCFGCVGLRNKQYYIFNKQYSKEEYFEKIKNFNLKYSKTLEIIDQLSKLILKYPHKFANIIKSVNSIGNDLMNVKDCKYCFESANNVENCKYVFYAVDGVKDSQDLSFIGLNAELCYETLSGGGYKMLSTVFALKNQNVSYLFNCHSSSNLFGCIGFRNKQYCILNKQYTKEEYEKLVPKIIEHMNSMPYIDKKSRIYKYGEFFPPELSPFSYNETIAQEYFPLTKEKALEQGYNWKEPEERNIKLDMKSEDLPDHIKDIKDDILDKVIQCGHSKIKEDGTLEIACNEQCVTAFKIIKPELEFYRKMNLPLPRLCPNCRHYQRIKQRNPLKLWHRKCQCAGRKSENGIYQNVIEHFHGTEPCPNEFETTYASERPEIVYCEQCYLKEVV